MINKEFLRYLDLFGTKCSFYTEQKLKLYTPLGGILSLASFAAGIFIFIYINMSSFKREDPTIITSSTEEENHKIKFNEEKIWIPWKISNNDNINNYFNHSEILTPIIKYYYKENNREIKFKYISYKPCSQTSMKNKPENFLIDSSLDNLYCIDMDDLFMGGSLSSEFFYYVEFSLFLCKEAINNDQHNSECIIYDKIDNSLEGLQLIIYYPILDFHQIDFERPIKIRYHKNFALLSENISKIEQLFIQKIVLFDKLGLFETMEKVHKYWAFSYINRDFTFNQNENQTNGKIYSLEILLDLNNIYYYRSYKSILYILAQSIPLIQLVHNLLKLIAKVFKLSSINRKMTELLFENLTQKTSKYDNYLEELKIKNNIKNNNINNINININKSTDDNTIINLNEIPKNKNIQTFTHYSLFKKRDKDKDINNISNNINHSSKKLSGSLVVNHKSIFMQENNKLKSRMNSYLKNLIIYKQLSLKYKDPAFPKKKRFVANKLFPFSYYFCAIFVKNIDITKHRFCMSRKFVKVYSFLSQLFDISSYCILQKEFNIVKNSLFDEQNIQLIEKRSKINVNSQSFMRDMNDCIGKHKFHILGKNNIRRKSEQSGDLNINNVKK